MNPATATARRAARLAHASDRLALLYRRRRTAGRPVAWLFPRCRRISAAWLEARDAELNA